MTNIQLVWYQNDNKHHQFCNVKLELLTDITKLCLYRQLYTIKDKYMEYLDGELIPTYVLEKIENG